ncbi:DUF6352 family protein [Cupriavidus basilensis]
MLDRDNAPAYWTRNERRDTVIRFASGSAALGAFSRVIARWVRHFFGVEVTVMPLSAIEDRHWAWHIGLDAQATQILNDLYRGRNWSRSGNGASCRCSGWILPIRPWSGRTLPAARSIWPRR